MGSFLLIKSSWFFVASFFAAAGENGKGRLTLLFLKHQRLKKIR
jgi:hypothetical protein